MRCEEAKTDSEGSMISKPFVHRMAILAFKKMTSYDSDWRKKSCQMESTIGIVLGVQTMYTYSVDTEPR
jgi:hypothetical protein